MIFWLITPGLSLADSISKGTEIIFADGSYADLVKSNGYKTFQFAGLNADEVMQGAARFEFSWLNITALEKVMKEQVRVIADLKPDLVIGDTSHTLKMSAELCKVRYVSLMNTYMSKYYTCTRKLPPIHPASRYQQKVPSKYFDHVIRIAERLAFRQVHAPFRTIRKNLGLKKTRDLLDEMEGDENILCDHPALFPHTKLPSNYITAGPLLYQKGIKADSPGNMKPVIYVSMGSSGDWHVLDFLKGEEYSKFRIVTTGDTKHILRADHIYNHGFIDPGNILSEAKLVICHGGNGTIYQALSHKVPVLARPSNFEQFYNLDGLKRCGVGEELDLTSKEQTRDQIEKWICKKSDPSFQSTVNSIFPETIKSLSPRIVGL